MLGARRVRAAALFCPPVEEPEREAGPAAMGHPPWGSEHGLYVVDVDAGGALERREPELQLPSQWARGWRFTTEHGDAMDSPQRRDGYPRKKGWRVLTHDPMPKRSATPRIALMI